MSHHQFQLSIFDIGHFITIPYTFLSIHQFLLIFRKLVKCPILPVGFLACLRRVFVGLGRHRRRTY